MSFKQERLSLESSLLSKWSLDSSKYGLSGTGSLLSTSSSLGLTGSLLSSTNTTSLLSDKSKLKRKEKPDISTKVKAKKGKSEKTESATCPKASKTPEVKAEIVASHSLLRSKIYQTPSLLSSTRKEEKPHLQSSLLHSSLLSSTRKKSDFGALSPSSNLLSSVTRSSLLSSSGGLKSSPFLGARDSVSTGRKAEKRKHEVDPVQTLSYKLYEVSPPEYDMGRYVLSSDEVVMEVPAFIPPEKDSTLSKIPRPLDDINGMKLALINAVSGSLICQPKFKDPNDRTRQQLEMMAVRVVTYDPEFILKVALYTRKQLNIRTTANFLLALSANIHPCRPFLKKYYSASIALPSDWIEVAEIYQGFDDANLNFGSLPAALRRAMAVKFPDFDKYQLAKYNKESSQKKKKRQVKKGKYATTRSNARGRGAHKSRVLSKEEMAIFLENAAAGKFKNSDYCVSSSSSESDSDEESLEIDRQKSVVYDDIETTEELMKMSFTLKQLIRKLHVTEPVEHVMCLIGKKYPSTLETFYQSRLPGTWDEERAGKRMKLPVPETWETQVSLKGNKASTWEDLIDHKKLPFMAMLRNLRNLIKAGISPKHHNSILKRLTDQKSVIYSKQFPFRFFSAYEVLETLEKDYCKAQQGIIEEACVNLNVGSSRGRGVINRGQGRGRGRGRGRDRGARGASGENWWLDRKKKRDEQAGKTKETLYDVSIISRYRKALDTAVKIATTYNVQPIRGRTVILCEFGDYMKSPCSQAKGLGKTRTLAEVGVLIGLMCKYSCEESEMLIFDENFYTCVDLRKGTILENMKVVMSTDLSQGTPMSSDMTIPDQFLWGLVRDRVQVDNLLFLGSWERVEHAAEKAKKAFFSDFLKKYRQTVNQNMLFVSVDFSGAKPGGTGFSEMTVPEHDNDIYISGYSDQILRFIAERGDGGQLTHVENIDLAFELKSISPVPLEQIKRPKLDLVIERPLSILSQTPRWRTARVFISSTFRDMHGERDLLTRYVFPELRAFGKKHYINVYEVDLRWGVTEEESRSNRSLEVCLSEISRCQFFIGILGERYGWTPDEYAVPDTPEFDWVREYKKGASITELEMHCAALSHPHQQKEKAFFYFRNKEFERDVPKEFKSDFLVEDGDAKVKMEKLKERIRQSGLEVYDSYSCEWGGIVDGKPMLIGPGELWSKSHEQYLECNTEILSY
ncbi:hypothetical protein ScPMuIL_001568 [Solemya velum]